MLWNVDESFEFLSARQHDQPSLASFIYCDKYWFQKYDINPFMPNFLDLDGTTFHILLIIVLFHSLHVAHPK